MTFKTFFDMVHDFAHLIWYINRFRKRMQEKKEKRRGFRGVVYSTPIVILCSKQVMYVMLLLWSTKWKGDLDILGTITKQQMKPLAIHTYVTYVCNTAHMQLYVRQKCRLTSNAVNAS